MFHAMRFAGFSEDGSAPLPALNLWFRATAPFQSSRSEASQQPYATYGGGSRTSLPGSSMKYYFQTNLARTVDVIADDVFSTVSLANTDNTNDLASKLLEVKAINSTAGALGARAFLDCGRLGPRFEPLYYGSGLSLGESCFEGCYGIREFAPRFLAKVTSSGVAAFARCTSLRTIDGMSAFDPCAERSFYRCASLLSLQGGFSAATTFGEKCFDGCSSLQTLSGVPATLEELLPYCFARCTSLSDITALASTALEELPEGCFYRCASLASPNCGTGSAITVFGESCFEDCSSLVSMAGTPAGLETMLARCFARTPVASLSGLPSTLTYVGDECYDACDLLPSLAGLPTSVLSIGERCFRDSYGEDHPAETPPEKVSTEWGLHDLSRLEDVVPGLTHKKIPKGCFTGDRMVRELPDLTGLATRLTVEDYAFSGCSGLDSLVGLPANVELKEGALMDCFRAPHDWWRLDETEDPPVIKKTKRWCGLYDVDMSGWANTVTKLPARCFQGCGALAELPPLPPKLMEMGDYCFAYCTGMKNLDSLADLDVQITDGSTHFGYGTPHGPTYPSFGEWCFAGCGVQTRGQTWEFFNDPEHPPDIGRLLNFQYSLKPLCDRMELQAASHMSASSSAIMDELLAYIEKVALDAMDTIVSYDVHNLYGYRMRSGLGTTDLLLLAGTVESASRAAASGWSVFTSGELKETLSQDYPLARNNVRHDVIAILMPRGDELALWICCPGLADDILESPLNTTEPTQLEATYGDYTVKFNVTFDDGDVDGIAARVYKTVGGSEFAVTDEEGLARTDFQEPADAEELALSFLKFMAYVDAALLAKYYDHAELSSAMELSTLGTYVLDKLTDGAAALSKLRDLNFVTPASKMLGAHCFDGCTYLDAGHFPKLIADVPPYCFANTAVAGLSNFSHVYTLGTGAFSHTLVEDMSGFPQAVAFVSSRLFQDCGSLVSATDLPRRTGSFGSYAYADCPLLADLKCEAEDAWPTGSSETNDLEDELARADGARDTYGLSHGYGPPLAAFTKARAVGGFGASCFQGDVALTDDAFTVEFEAGSSGDAVQRVRDALGNPDIFTSSGPSSGSMKFTLVFHLADDLDFVVEANDDPSAAAPYAIDSNGDVSLTDRASAISSVNVLSHRDAVILDYDGSDYTSKVVRLCWDDDEYVPSESTDPEVVTPARQRPTEQNAPDVASVDPDGYVKLLLETEGRRFEALVSVKVDRTTNNGSVTKAEASITGVAVTDTADSWPGYPEAGSTMKYSAVPLLKSVGASCFEGCTGLGSLDWIPFGVTQFPSRCFAGVPFTHPLQYTIPAPAFLGWSSPTVDAYKDAIDYLCGSSKFYVQEIDGDNDYIPDSLKLYVNWDDTDYILFAVTYTTVNGVLVPSLALDPDHTATADVNGDAAVPTYGYDFPSDAPSLGSTYGLSGPVEVLDVQGNVATLKVGELTMTMTVTNSSTSPSYVSLRYDREYVSCPPYDAMKYALRQLQASTASFASGVWHDVVLGSEALRLAFDANTGTWASTYQDFAVPVSAATGADEYEFGMWSWLDDERRETQEAHERFWFQASVPGETGDADDKPYRTMYAYAKVKALPVPVKANSVAVPPWVYSIGKDCFTFKGFEDAQEKLEALYIDKSPKDIRAMSNYPWGVPSGCVICSTMGGVVYEAP